MSNLDAFRSSVTGMAAQSAKLSAISNNIANASTTGFKRTDTQFESMVLGTAAGGAPIAAGTRAVQRVEISKAGQLQSTGNPTDIAISGGGFLVVNRAADDSGAFLATRAGSFRLDAEGNLVNGAGYFLQGVPTDATGAMTGGDGTTLGGLKTVNLSGVAVDAAPTTRMGFWANLPVGQTTAGAAGTAYGSSVDYYDPLGRAQTLTFRFAPTVATEAGTSSNTWTMTVADSASGADPIGTVTLGFDGGTGRLKQVGGADAAAYDAATGALTVKAGGGTQPIAIDIGMPGSASGLTQLSGDFFETRVDKDGAAPGTLQGVTVASDGKVVASFTNGQSRPVYQLRLATVTNPDGLTPVQGDAFEFSTRAGELRLGNPGEGTAGTTVGGALESSNVDMNVELTNLIETQRAYSSNATVIRTADEMLQETNNLKR